MNVKKLKLLLEQFEDEDLVVLSTGKESIGGWELYRLERVMASKLKTEGEEDILCAIFWPDVREI